MLAAARSLRRLSSSSSSSVRALRRVLLHPPPPPPSLPPPLPPLRTLAHAVLPHLAAAHRFSTASFSTSAPSRLGECVGVRGAPEIPEEEGEETGALVRHDTDAYAAVELALDSVVKVFTVSSSPNYFLPWQNKAQRESMGSGFVIPGRRIVTNAHVVADHTFVLVRKHGSPTKYKAEVQAVGHECDLALLTVESEEFWDGVNSLELGDIPFLQEAVAVVGYPQGGDNISVTKGVVSRVEPTQYAHGATQLMAIQIDAAINPVPFRNRERITFDHLVSMKKPEETAILKVLRDGKVQELRVTLRPLQPLVPVHQFDKLPSYYIFAGFVFIPLTQPYLHEFGEDWYNASPRRLCERALRELPKKAGEQLVILSQVLMDDINVGYERLAELQVKKVNGVEVENLKHLCSLVEGCTEGNLRFDLDDERVIVLKYQNARLATSRVLKRHRIPSAISSDLLSKMKQLMARLRHHAPANAGLFLDLY